MSSPSYGPSGSSVGDRAQPGQGTNGGQPFERRLWYSDTYVRTATGWRYVFGQASLPLP